MKLIFVFFSLLLMFNSCSKKNCPTQGTIIDEGEIISNVSFEFDSIVSKNEYLIRNSAENIVKAKCKFENQSNFDSINFSTYSLIGKRVSTNSGGIITKKNVIFNSATKEVNCTIETKSCGKNKVELTKLLWILVKKVPDDYSIKFNIIDN